MTQCVSCGMCLVNCPFGAIADKGQIFQVIHAMKTGTPVYAAVAAPAFIGQFGRDLTPERLREAMKRLGFADIMEVAVGADLCTMSGSPGFPGGGAGKHPFMATSCCPAWAEMARKMFPDLAPCISMALTPMVLTGRLSETGTSRMQGGLYRSLFCQEAGSQQAGDPQRHRVLC